MGTSNSAAPSDVVVKVEAPRNRQPTVKRTAILVVASLLAYFSTHLHAITRIQHTDIDAVLSTDDIFPIAPSEPWDISTDFAYARRVAFDVDEGTWLRLDVHPVSGEIIFDMLGDIYCLPPGGGEARAVLLGTPFDAEPRFSPEGDRLLFRSDAGQGTSNLYILPWTSCEDMAVRPSLHPPHTVRPEIMEALKHKDHDEELLAGGVPETHVRREHRLMREGRLRAVPVTNETFRRLERGRFHPSGTRILGVKMYEYTAEPWDWPVLSAEELNHAASSSSVGPGKRLLHRTLPPFWQPSLYDRQSLGMEMAIWVSEDEIVYAFNQEDYDTNGSHFTYNKDVHKGIYALYIANVTSGEKRQLVSNKPGGATAPEISRDGRTLAFVRRVRDKEALVLVDLTTGTLRNIWYGLSYDTQAEYLPQSAYPSFSFAPDDSSIVIWAAGKIWRVPLMVLPSGERAAAATEQPRIIPFTAHVEKRVAQLITNEKDLVHTETASTQRVHSFHGLRLDESNSRALVADHASSYLVHLKGFDPRIVRIPTLHKNKAYYSPNFVPDSPSILHVRWSDTDFSALELVDMNTLAVRELSGVPAGRIYGPTVSAAGGANPSLRSIAWIRSGGDAMTGPVAHTLGAGLYLATLDLSSAKVSSVRLVSRDVVAARETKIRFFNGDKYLVVEHERGACAINLVEGNAQIPFANGNFTKEVSVALRTQGSLLNRLVGSSDLPSISATAFIDFAHLYVTRTKDVPLFSGTRGDRAPKDLIQVSVAGGHDLIWSVDGETLFWLFGPELLQVSIQKLADECGNLAKPSAAKCAQDLTRRLILNVEYETDVARMQREADSPGNSASGVWLVNATLVTMKTGVEDRDVVPEAAILLKDGVIQRLMHMRTWEEDMFVSDSLVIDVEHGYVLPGFIDAHAHFDTSLYPVKSWDKAALLAYGVTTAQNPSTVRDANLERNRIESGYMLGPRLFHTDTPVLSIGGPSSQEINSMDDAFAAIERITAEQGPAASLAYKNYLLRSRDQQQRMLLAARNKSILCVPEGGMFYDWDLTYIIDGMNTIEHSLPLSVLYEDVKQLFLATGVANTPTHLVTYGGAFGEQRLWGANIPNDEKLRRFLPHGILEGISETTLRPDDSWQLYNVSTYLADLAHRGLPVLIGAHGESPIGLAYHAELEFAQAGGLSSYETFRAATRSAAEVFGLFNSIGSIEPGKLADLVVYPPGVDVLKDIRLSRKLKYVIRGGRIWEADDLTEVWPVKGREYMSSLPPLSAD